MGKSLFGNMRLRRLFIDCIRGKTVVCTILYRFNLNHYSVLTVFLSTQLPPTYRFRVDQQHDTMLLQDPFTVSAFDLDLDNIN